MPTMPDRTWHNPQLVRTWYNTEGRAVELFDQTVWTEGFTAVCVVREGGTPEWAVWLNVSAQIFEVAAWEAEDTATDLGCSW